MYKITWHIFGNWVHFSVEELQHLGTKSGCKVRCCTEQTVKDCKDNGGNLSQEEKEGYLMKVVIDFDLVGIKIYSIIYNQMYIITIKSIWFLKIFKKYHVIHNINTWNNLTIYNNLY